MLCKSYYLNPQGDLESNLSNKEIKTVFESGIGLLWTDITDLTESDKEEIQQIFHFHSLSIEDAVNSEHHPAKIDSFDTYLFIIIHGINYATKSDIVDTAELSIFLGSHFVVTIHNSPMYNIEAVINQIEKDGLPMKNGADFLAHTLIDTLIDNISPTIDRMIEVANEVEEEAILNPHQSTLESILKLKRSSLRIHRTISPQTEVLNRLSRGEFSIIKKEAEIYYRDIYDHMVRIGDLNQTIRDRADNILTTYLSSIANRQNETMRVLSIVATIFLPLTLLAGIYGMNFENMPELRWQWGYFVVVGFILIVILVLVWYFWAKNWISWGRRKVIRVRSLIAAPEKLIGYVGQITGLKHPSEKE